MTDSFFDISTNRRRQAGVGLIEVLIAVLVFAVGVLGMAAMQISAKRTSYEATQRSMATSMARDILERIRSNPDNLNAYVTASAIGEGSLPTSGNCVSSACDPNDLAVYDLYDWSLSLVGNSEKSGTANVGGLLDSRACIANDSRTIWVAIAWKGVTEMTNPDPNEPPAAIADCGNSSGLYGTNNVNRRLLVMSTYVGDF